MLITGLICYKTKLHGITYSNWKFKDQIDTHFKCFACVCREEANLL